MDHDTFCLIHAKSAAFMSAALQFRQAAVVRCGQATLLGVGVCTPSASSLGYARAIGWVGLGAVGHVALMNGFWSFAHRASGVVKQHLLPSRHQAKQVVGLRDVVFADTGVVTAGRALQCQRRPGKSRLFLQCALAVGLTAYFGAVNPTQAFSLPAIYAPGRRPWTHRICASGVRGKSRLCGG